MNTRTGLIAAVTAIVFWAAGNIIVRSIDLPGMQIAFWRVVITAILYWGILLAAGRKLTWAQLKRSAPAGIAITLEIAIFFIALKATTVANTTVIGALQPIVVLFFGIRRFGEQVTARLVGLAGLALVGVTLVVFGSSAQPIWSPRGDLLAFVAMLLFAAYYILAKSARYDVPALEFQTAIWVVGSIVLLPFAIFDAGGLVIPAAEHWRGIGLLLLIPATGHFLMNWAHPRVELSVTSLLTLGIPVLSAIGAALLLDEPIVGWQVPGIAIVLAALAAAIRHQTRFSAEHPDPTSVDLEPEPQA